MLPVEKNQHPFFFQLDSLQLDTGRYERIIGFTLVIAGLFLLDILTTQVILRMGGVELNPLMAIIVVNPALHVVIKATILLLIFFVSIIAEQRVQGSTMYFFGILIPLYLVIVANNVMVILPRIPI